MTGFFDRMLGRGGKEGSGALAKSRLEVVLVHDRIDLSPERLRELKQELLAVIAKYVPIDPDSVNIAVEQPDRNSSRLLAEIPFGKGKILNLVDEDYTEDDDLDGIEKKSTLETAAVDAAADSVTAGEPDSSAPAETATMQDDSSPAAESGDAPPPADEI